MVFVRKGCLQEGSVWIAERNRLTTAGGRMGDVRWLVKARKLFVRGGKYHAANSSSASQCTKSKQDHTKENCCSPADCLLEFTVSKDYVRFLLLLVHSCKLCHSIRVFVCTYICMLLTFCIKSTMANIYIYIHTHTHIDR